MTDIAQRLILTVAGQYEPWQGIMAFSFLATLSLFTATSPWWASMVWEEDRAMETRTEERPARTPYGHHPK